MKAVRIHQFGESEVLQVDNIDEPVCQLNQVKIKMKACGINHLDIWVRKGLPWITFPWVLGSDGAGVIVEFGSKVEDWKIGDDVVIHPGYSCGDCIHCENNQENGKKHILLKKDASKYKMGNTQKACKTYLKI